jgi:hypothetical protein
MVDKPVNNQKGICLFGFQLIRRLVVIYLVAAVLLIVLQIGNSIRSAHATYSNGSVPHWRRLEQGLDFRAFKVLNAAIDETALVHVLRVDPQHYQFKLLNVSAQPKGRLRTAKQWCRQYGLTAAINASMYQKDYKTSVSYMRTRNHINNPRLSKDMSLLAFDRRTPHVPLVRLIDRQCDDFARWKKDYITWIQSIRMISCKGVNVWHQQPQKWSTAAIGSDRWGRILFMYVGSPYSTHDLINVMKQLPLAIERAMYLEGGPQAQLYIKAGGEEYEFSGGGLLNQSTRLDLPIDYPIPNVIAIKPRASNGK